MQHSSDFSFIDEGAVYLDAACQSLRPLSVQAALQEYYQYYNSCGERVKHEWGARVDETIQAKYIPTMIYDGKRHDGLFKAQ